MVVGNLVLLGLSLIIIFFALSVIFNRSAIASAFSLISVMVLLGAIYAMIGVYFIAAIQIIVYAGAIMVLFVFSIMLLNDNEKQKDLSFASPLVLLAIVSAFVLVIGLLKVFGSPYQPLATAAMGVFDDAFVNDPKQGGNIMVLSKLLFSQYYMHFEIVSLLLLVALVGALTVAKRKVD